MAAEGHTLSPPVARRPGQQADQRQVVVVAQAVIIWVEEDLGHGVLLLVLFRDQSVIVPQPDLVLLGGVAVPAGVTRMAEPFVSDLTGYTKLKDNIGFLHQEIRFTST